MTTKFKSVNAFTRENGTQFLCITLENGDVTFINLELIKYACEHASAYKKKDNKEAK